MLQSAVSEEILIKQFTSAIPPENDPFWDMAEKNLLEVLARYAYRKMPEERRTLHDACNLLTGEGLVELGSYFMSLEASHPARVTYDNFNNTNPAIKAAIIAGVLSRMRG